MGGKTQPQAIQSLAGSLRLDYAQFLELEVFARFGQVLDPRTERVLEHGRRVRAVLAQPQSEPRSLAAEVALLLAVQERALDGLPLERVATFKQALGQDLLATHPEIVDRIDRSGRLDDADKSRLLEWLRSRSGGPPMGKA